MHLGLSEEGEDLCRCVAKPSRENSTRVGAEIGYCLDGSWVRHKDCDLGGQMTVEVVLGESGGRDQSTHVYIEGRYCGPRIRIVLVMSSPPANATETEVVDCRSSLRF